ncbi:MAG: CPBP family intramembrane metalloprotease, partial [Spirochaetaceae bacterium]|nr:CPBP family intramembrane metalloprotease [Spirochaetaceae bacterium]
QILLILYFFYIKKWDLKDNYASNCSSTILSRVLKIFFLIVIYTVLLIILTNSAALLLRITGFMQNVPTINSSKQLIPLYLLVSIITGYREELFFRAYIIKFFEKTTNKTALTLLISAMFAICHISQGFGAIIVSFINSMLLCFIFFRHRNIHINAISHALYNFFVLLASVFVV